MAEKYSGPDKKKGAQAPREAAEAERDSKREAGRTDIEKETDLGRGTNLERAGTSDAVRDAREYGEGVTQNE